MEKIKYRTYNGTVIDDITVYVSDYIALHPTVEIHLGCDSQREGGNIIYGLALCLYVPGHGGHVVKKKIKVNSNPNRYEKLWREVEISVEAADELGCVIENQQLTIHVDYNSKPNTGSNGLYDAGLGYITGHGYKALGKPNAWASSVVADRVCRNK